MRWFKAIAFSTFLFLQVLACPILNNYYIKELKIVTDGIIPVIMFEVLYFILLFIVSIIFYVSAINDKDPKDLRF